MLKQSIGLVLAAGIALTATPAIAYTRNTAPNPTAVSVCTAGSAKITWDKNLGKPDYWDAVDLNTTYAAAGSIANSAMSKGFTTVSWGGFVAGHSYTIKLTNPAGNNSVTFTNVTC